MRSLYVGATWRRDNAISKQPSVYLTFDDGPIPEMTPRILDILREKGVKATFFVVGDNVRKYPHLLEQILAEGHRVGNHTFHHLKGLKTPLDDYMQDVAACHELLSEKGAVNADNRLPLFRPPYGRITQAQYKALLKSGYEVVVWDVLTHDYNARFSSEKLLTIVQRYTRNGSIVVFHDSLKSGERMLRTLPQAIDWWQSQGYILQTL